MSNGITNWQKEKADGQFIATSQSPQKLDWWVQQVIKGRQLSMAPANVRTKLINFNNQKIIKGNINGEFNQMFIGVYQNDFSLYQDVSTKVNDLIKKAINETWQMTQAEDFQKSQNMLDFLTALGIYLITVKAKPNQVTMLVEQFLKGISLGTILKLAAVTGAVVLTGVKAHDHVLKFMYKSPWGSYIKHRGRWDFKHHTAPFSNVKEGTASRYFYYKNNGRPYRLQNPGETQLPGLMRYDDPGNICYGATGKILLSSLDGAVEKWMLREFADMYALLDNPEYSHLSNNPRELLNAYFKEQGFRKNLDDPWDLAAIGYGYDAF